MQTLVRLLFAAVVAAVPVASAAGVRGFFQPHVEPLPFFDLRPLEDQIEILERGTELFAIDPWSGSAARIEIALEEEVLWSGVRGRVALVVTNRRLLAAVPASDWNPRSLHLSESEPLKVVLGDRVALVATDQRVLAFEGVLGTWSETSLRPRERVLSAAAGTNVAVAVTRTRALGVAAMRGGLFEAELGIREEAEAVRVHGSFATIETRLRLLTFRAPDGTWQSTNLPFR